MSQKSHSSSTDRLDAWFRGMFIAGIFCLAYLAGASTVFFQIFPYSILNKAFIGIEAQKTKWRSAKGAPRLGNFYAKAHATTGVTRHVPEKTWPGYTFCTVISSPKAVLLDMNGKMAHSWSLPFHKVWPEPKHIEHPVHQHNITFHQAHLLPNGDVLAVYEGYGDTPYGYGIAKIDLNSRLIWSFADYAHHDLNIGEDGDIYCLTQKYIDPPQSSGIELPILAEYAVVLNSDGQEIDRISLYDALVQSRFDFPLENKTGDCLHANSIKYITRKQAAVLPFAEPGDLLISFRELNTLVILDPKSRNLRWAAQQFWARQHDPDILDTGDIILFDNRGLEKEGMFSRVLIYDPRKGDIVWQFRGTAEEPLYSEIRGCQQPLPNGNVLITVSDEGRMLEVTREKEIVWEYYSETELVFNGVSYAPNLCSGQRFTAEELPFLQQLDAQKNSLNP
ncbi:hypothetical protein JXA32_16890 [Candidatus Sumerlaeota bacterium]|nr:hypothetical protein [Candidatus Sumerlaeota bacterium]